MQTYRVLVSQEEWGHRMSPQDKRQPRSTQEWTYLEYWSPFRCRGTKKEGKHWVRSCKHGTILRKTPGQKPVVPWEQSIFLTSVRTGGVAEPEAPEACLFEAPSGSLQDSQPIFIHASDLWHMGFAQGSPGQALLPSDANRSFTCICCTLTRICFTLHPLIPTWIIVTEVEVLTILLHCEKNAALLSLQRTQKMFVVKQKAFWRSTGKS